MNKNKPADLAVRDTLRLFCRTALNHRRDALLALLNPIGVLLMGVAVPYFAGKVLAGLARSTPNTNTALALLAIVSIAGILANRIGFQAVLRLQAKTMDSLQAMVFDHLLRRSVGFHVNRISGKLISDAIDFAAASLPLIGLVYASGLPFLLVIVSGIIIVFINSWQLGLYLLMVASMIISWTLFESRRRAGLRSKRLIATKNLTAHLSDTIVNAQTVKTFAREVHEKRENIRLGKILQELRLRDWQRAGRSGNDRIGALLVLQCGMMLLVSHLVHGHPTMLATGIFALTYTLSLSTRLFEFDTLTRQVDEAFLQAAPMTKVLQQKVEIADRPGAKELKVTRGQIDIQDASFSYKESANQTTVFEHLSLHITPGERIGLIGPSGGGKSTLTRLLLRFDDLQDGSIAIDGQDIADVKQTSLRKNIAYVPQEPLLFHRSIRENIAYGRPQATEEEIFEAARQAQAHDFIQALPSGYDTIVGERGVKLSGGQRQRIAIARAILKDAPILILDEATSALDSESEVAIQKALWALMKGRTAIVVAHRLSTIQRMDRIIVLEHGQIVESGTHHELLATKGTYARLWNHQSGGFIEAMQNAAA